MRKGAPVKTIVWLKNDLRLIDSRALSMALRDTPAGDIVVVRAKDGTLGHVPPTARRIVIENEHVKAMQPLLAHAGIAFVDARDTETIVPLAVRLGASRVLANIEISDDIGFANDRRVARQLRAAGIRFVETATDGIRRGHSARRTPAPFITSAADLAPIRFARKPAALVSLDAYLKRLPFSHYRRDMWLPGPDARASSRLSIDIACGALSGDRAIHTTEAALRDCQPHHASACRQFLARFQWRQGFIQTLEDSVDAFPWAPVREERPEDDLRMKVWLAGETGYPLVDAAMRDLAATGWINFRLRQVLSSFALDLLDLDMHKVGVALGALFDDYCPGIHWPQIGLQAGMAQGRGPRVVNPVKQAQELDPDGAYVRRWLPHVAALPEAFAIEPWRHPAYRGPSPIVDYRTAARAARLRAPAPERSGSDFDDRVCTSNLLM